MLVRCGVAAKCDIVTVDPDTWDADRNPANNLWPGEPGEAKATVEARIGPAVRTGLVQPDGWDLVILATDDIESRLETLELINRPLIGWLDMRAGERSGTAVFSGEADWIRRHMAEKSEDAEEHGCAATGSIWHTTLIATEALQLFFRALASGGSLSETRMFDIGWDRPRPDGLTLTPLKGNRYLVSP
jgi:hypothetical protein